MRAFELLTMDNVQFISPQELTDLLAFRKTFPDVIQESMTQLSLGDQVNLFRLARGEQGPHARTFIEDLGYEGMTILADAVRYGQLDNRLFSLLTLEPEQRHDLANLYIDCRRSILALQQAMRETFGGIASSPADRGVARMFIDETFVSAMQSRFQDILIAGALPNSFEETADTIILLRKAMDALRQAFAGELDRYREIHPNYTEGTNQLTSQTITYRFAESTNKFHITLRPWAVEGEKGKTAAQAGFRVRFISASGELPFRIDFDPAPHDISLDLGSKGTTVYELMKRIEKSHHTQGRSRSSFKDEATFARFIFGMGRSLGVEFPSKKQ